MDNIPEQKLLFFPAKLDAYSSIFDHLNLKPLLEIQNKSTGRKPFPRQGICRALIYKNLKGIRTLSELELELSTNLGISYICGFPDRVPSRHRYEEFLHSTPNELLQKIRKQQVRTLIALGIIKGKYLSIDSTAIVAWVKQNNPKVFVEGKFDKTKFPKGDSDARLGVMIAQNSPHPKTYVKEQQLELFSDLKEHKRKQIQFFWGYRNHTIFDSISELPVLELTKPANIAECKVTVPAFKQVIKDFNFKPKGILGDAIHDSEYIRRYTRKTLKAKDFIPINPRSSKPEIKTTPKNTRVCIAGFEMYPWGKFKDRGKIRQKFVCPILYLKRFAKKYPKCPMNHPRFFKGGCYAYTRIDKSYRASCIDPKSEYFKNVYKFQSGAERGFSRLLNVYMQYPILTGLNAVANHCTLAHITILAIAIAAVKTNNPDKFRFVKGLIKELSG